MGNFDWEIFWREYRTQEIESKPDLFYQVGKTINKEPISEKLFEKNLKDIAYKLQLSSQDVLLEMCCGNGLVTKPLSYYCKNVYAFDFTKHLIETAIKLNFGDNITYKLGNAKADFLDLFEFNVKPNKLLMCFSLGYFSPSDLFKMIEYLVSNLDSFSFYLTEIPNDSLKWNFYDTDERMKYYYSLQAKGDNANNGIGRWWKIEEITEIANAFNLKITVEDQTEVYNYRMNILLEKESNQYES